jgi:hypothetical protein
MILTAYSKFYQTQGDSISILFEHFDRMNLIKTDFTKEDKTKLDQDMDNIVTNGTALEFINYIKNNVLIGLASDQEKQESLKQRLTGQGLNPEDKILIYDVCSHSGASMNAVIKAFNSIGYNNLKPVLMQPPKNDNHKKHYLSLTDHPSFNTCYPFRIAQNSSTECLRKPPDSLICEIRNSFQLDDEQNQMRQLIKTYLAKYH